LSSSGLDLPRQSFRSAMEGLANAWALNHQVQVKSSLGQILIALT
jgi:hypothetical protein